MVGVKGEHYSQPPFTILCHIYMIVFSLSVTLYQYLYFPVINLLTNKCVRVIGKVSTFLHTHLPVAMTTVFPPSQEENVRFLNLALHQGQVGKKLAVNVMVSGHCMLVVFVSGFEFREGKPLFLS